MKGNVYFYHGRGKMGNTVLYTLYGQQCGRAYVGKGDVANPRTVAQQLQRAKIALLTKASIVFRSAARLGFADEARSRGCSAVNYFVHQNYSKVTGLTPEAVTLPPAQILVSKGTAVPVVFSSSLNVSTPGAIGMTVTDVNAGVEGASAEDKIYAFVYCPDAGMGILSAGKPRTDGQIVTVTYPDSWSGLEVHAYGFVVDVNGKSSDSGYIGHAELS